ncbi:MAG: BID domain-containing protein [Sphingobium sp.]
MVGSERVIALRPSKPDIAMREKDEHPNKSREHPPLLPAQQVPDLSADEITRRAEAAMRVQSAKSAAEGLAETAYGDRSSIAMTLRDIADSDRPAAYARERARQIEAAPETLGDLPGRGATMFRGPDQERRTAQAAVVDLSVALEKYGDTLAYERAEIERAHKAEQRRLATPIPAPSKALDEVLATPAPERAAALQKRPDAAAELTVIVQAGRMRLGADDHRDMAAGDSTAIAGRHNISRDQATRLSSVYRQSAALHQDHQTLVRQQARTRDIELSISVRK